MSRLSPFGGPLNLDDTDAADALMSVIVLVVRQDSVLAVEDKSDAPFSAAGHEPTPIKLALQ
jgi:hypothetical protein